MLEVARPARPESDDLGDQLAEPLRLLSQIRQDRSAEAATRERLADLSAAEAFEAGREFERNAVKTRRTRRDFVKLWGKTAKKLDA